MKNFSLDDSIYDVVSKYPESKDILISLGFSHLADPKMFNTIARVITLRKASKNHNLTYELVNQTFLDAGFEIIEEEL